MCFREQRGGHWKRTRQNRKRTCRKICRPISRTSTTAVTSDFWIKRYSGRNEYLHQRRSRMLVANIYSYTVTLLLSEKILFVVGAIRAQRLKHKYELWVQGELWIAPRRFNFTCDLDKTWQRFKLFFFLSNEICMTYLVHVWFDAAYKKRIRGTQCGHQGMERVLKDIGAKTVKNKTCTLRSIKKKTQGKVEIFLLFLHSIHNFSYKSPGNY